MAIRSKHINGGNMKDISSVTPSMYNQNNMPSSLSPVSNYSSRRRLSSRKVEKNDSVVGLLEAMKDSSPPRVRCNVESESVFDYNTLCTNTTIDQMEYYRAWKANHPSALENFDKIFELAKGKPIFVFLDYDGTLSPIVEDPDCAFMSEEMRSTVKEISSLFPTAIITGRSREKVYEFVQVRELYYAGSHGMDIMGPAVCRNGSKAKSNNVLDQEDNDVALFQPASEYTIMMDEIFKLLDEKASKVPGAKVEHNKFCVSVHFRRVKEENWKALAEQVQNVLKSYPNVCLTQGRKVLEVRPCISWNKGKALDYLLRTLGYGNRSDVFPIYIGDDQTDEDAFKAVVRKKHGLAILVSNVVKETNAICSLKDPDEVLQFLQNLAKWKRKCIYINKHS